VAADCVPRSRLLIQPVRLRRRHPHLQRSARSLLSFSPCTDTDRCCCSFVMGCGCLAGDEPVQRSHHRSTGVVLAIERLICRVGRVRSPLTFSRRRGSSFGAERETGLPHSDLIGRSRWRTSYASQTHNFDICNLLVCLGRLDTVHAAHMGMSNALQTGALPLVTRLISSHHHRFQKCDVVSSHLTPVRDNSGTSNLLVLFLCEKRLQRS
jgi:hypothetical protein